MLPGLRQLSRLGLMLVPHVAQRLATELVLNRVLKSALQRGDLSPLDGRVAAVSITDLDWYWPISLSHGRLCFVALGTPADVTIQGKSPAFLRLLARNVDPDTLFFHRELIIQGDTELGLVVKNTLDGVDLQTLPANWAEHLARALAL